MISAIRTSPAPLSDRQLAAYARDGYVAGGPLLTTGEVEELRCELDRVIGEREATTKAKPVHIANLSSDPACEVWQVVNIWQASPAFARLLQHPRLVAMLRQLAGPDAGELRLWHDQIQYKPPGHGGVNWWHQDAPYWPVLAPQDSLLTAWIALDEVSLDNGCMSMVPGSQAWGDTIDHLHACGERSRDFWRSLGEEFQDRPVHVVPRPVALGGVHFHHALTWHGSHENRSTRPRRAIALHVMTSRTIHQPRGPHVMSRFITAPPGGRISDAAFPVLG
ncbi:MAG TPA: phytanoyl-CoA dioxygenase family protein [Planctomycetes bacterium]|nr:phytanoyl-CoA dioxygenase family protein [Planctomycetota bacterium]